jgi:hypothetical protein
MRIEIEDYSHPVIPKINLFPKHEIYCLIFNKFEECDRYKDGEEIAEIRMDKEELKELIKTLQGLVALGEVYNPTQKKEVQNGN